jgi:hypothetical protein
MIDIVTVVFDEELSALQSQAQSVARYCKNLSIGKIYVVVNDAESVQQSVDTKWWKDLSSKVVVLHRDSLTVQLGGQGWVDQQILKLLSAAYSDNKWSLVLDAKTIFVQEFSDATLFDNHRACVGEIDIFPVFEPSRKIVESVFDIHFKKQLGPGGVPFVFHNSTVRGLIQYIEQRCNKKFTPWFLEKGSVTEFMLYSGYVQQQGVGDQLYHTVNKIIPCNICHSEIGRFDAKLAEAAHSQTVSIHRNAWRQLTAEQQQRYKTFLLERGIVYQ